MTPALGSDPVAIKVAGERAWAYERWMQRLSYSAMRWLANLPPAEGGLGYDLSESALRGLVKSARDDRGDLTMSREDRIERQSAEVDERGRGAIQDYVNARTMLDQPRPVAADFMEREDYLEALLTWSKTVEAGLKAVESAERRLEAVHNREAKLHGLDAPTEAKVEVTTRDAVTAELEAMLARQHTSTPSKETTP